MNAYREIIEILLYGLFSSDLIGEVKLKAFPCVNAGLKLSNYGGIKLSIYR